MATNGTNSANSTNGDIDSSGHVLKGDAAEFVPRQQDETQPRVAPELLPYFGAPSYSPYHPYPYYLAPGVYNAPVNGNYAPVLAPHPGQYYAAAAAWANANGDAVYTNDGPVPTNGSPYPANGGPVQSNGIPPFPANPFSNQMNQVEVAIMVDNAQNGQYDTNGHSQATHAQNGNGNGNGDGHSNWRRKNKNKKKKENKRAKRAAADGEGENRPAENGDGNGNGVQH